MYAIAPTTGQSVSTQSLRAGTVLDHDIYDDHGVLMLACGQTINDRFVDQLKRRRIHTVRVRPERRKRIKAPTLDDELSAFSIDLSDADFEGPPQSIHPAPQPTSHAAELERFAEPPPEISPALAQLIERAEMPALPTYASRAALGRRLNLRDLHAETQAAVETINQRETVVQDIFMDAAAGGTINFEDGREIAKELERIVRIDRSIPLLAMQLKTKGDDYLFHHGLNTAMLCIALATRFGFSEQVVTRLALAGLFQDLGMTRVPTAVRHANRKLTAAEWQLVHMHPTHTVNMLEQVRAIDRHVQIIAYQAHERGDRSGYPRKRTATLVHPLAKILAVADTYIAAISERPHRTNQPAYRIMERMLKDASAGRFELTVVRALIDEVGLFPVGSFVKLSNNHNARVIRANGSQHTRPVVLPVDESGRVIDREIDLSQNDSLRVIAAITHPGGPAV